MLYQLSYSHSSHSHSRHFSFKQPSSRTPCLSCRQLNKLSCTKWNIIKWWENVGNCYNFHTICKLGTISLLLHKYKLVRFFTNEKFPIHAGISLQLKLSHYLSIKKLNLLRIIFPVLKWIFAITKYRNSWHLCYYFPIVFFRIPLSTAYWICNIIVKKSLHLGNY